MEKVIVRLSCSLDMYCPHCDEPIGLLENDDDHIYAKAIFENRWDDLNLQEDYCHHCKGYFEIEGVEY